MPSNNEPTWIRQARALFSELESKAEQNKYHQLIWTGKLQDVWYKLSIPNANKPRVVALLETIGAIRIDQRGNRHQPTIVELFTTTEKLSRQELLPPEHLTPAAHTATLALESLTGRVERLEAWRESLEKGGLDLAKVFRDFELRITKLEREVLHNGKKS